MCELQDEAETQLFALKEQEKYLLMCICYCFRFDVGKRINHKENRPSANR